MRYVARRGRGGASEGRVGEDDGALTQAKQSCEQAFSRHPNLRTNLKPGSPATGTEAPNIKSPELARERTTVCQSAGVRFLLPLTSLCSLVHSLSARIPFRSRARPHALHDVGDDLTGGLRLGGRESIGRYSARPTPLGPSLLPTWCSPVN